MTQTDEAPAVEQVAPFAVPDDHPDRRDWTAEGRHGSPGWTWHRHTWQLTQLQGTEDDDYPTAVPRGARDLVDTISAEHAESGHVRTKRIEDGNGKLVAVVVSADTYNDGVTAEDTLRKLAERGSLPGLRPFLDGPYGQERLLPVEDLEPRLAWWMYGKRLNKGDVLTEEESTRVHMAAIDTVFHVEFDADSTGYVPVMSTYGSRDRGTEYRWRLAKRTGNPGLFLVQDYGVMGWDTAVITGSGYVLSSFGGDDRAELFVRNLSTVLPGVDWRVVGIGDTTTAMLASVRAAYAAANRLEESPPPPEETEPEQPAAAAPPADQVDGAPVATTGAAEAPSAG